MMRGLRGAITVMNNHEDEILNATSDLIKEIFYENPLLKTQDISYALFTVTEDLDAAFPAKAARDMGWIQVPLLCAREIPVPNSLPLCIRLLIHWNTELPQNEINHVYLKEAKILLEEIDLAQKSQN